MVGLRQPVEAQKHVMRMLPIQQMQMQLSMLNGPPTVQDYLPTPFGVQIMLPLNLLPKPEMVVVGHLRLQDHIIPVRMLMLVILNVMQASHETEAVVQPLDVQQEPWSYLELKEFPMIQPQEQSPLETEWDAELSSKTKM